MRPTALDAERFPIKPHLGVLPPQDWHLCTRLSYLPNKALANSPNDKAAAAKHTPVATKSPLKKAKSAAKRLAIPVIPHPSVASPINAFSCLWLSLICWLHPVGSLSAQSDQRGCPVNGLIVRARARLPALYSINKSRSLQANKYQIPNTKYQISNTKYQKSNTKRQNSIL